MKLFMMWFCTNPKLTTEQNIQQATDYYKNKYGVTPDLVYTYLGCGKCGVLGFEVKEKSNVLPGHLWVGVSE